VEEKAQRREGNENKLWLREGGSEAAAQNKGGDPALVVVRAP